MQGEARRFVFHGVHMTLNGRNSPKEEAYSRSEIT